MSSITARQLGKSYGRGAGTVHALSDVSFTINSGEFVGIMGESGAGKSTLLSILGAMNTPSTGTLKVDDIDVYDLRSEQRADFRREFLGFVFQSFYLIPYLTLLENVMLPLAAVRMAASEKRHRALAALERVGLGGKEARLPGEASGGEKERCAIARAIVNAPPVLLADEPTGNLDTRTTDAVMDLFADLNGEGMTIVMVTHSHRCAAHVHRVLTVSDGRMPEER
ncbi:ABC transporter ATP-binding protein [Desulfosarcina alkanivorans]|jgi:putative ABC transport system ATP-binding protein|uniref:ABC transporter ATP-binding protein n=1 Tax=Desulfosarcina alkanivorans TaxID=571177 RepID=A0A5K7YT48_9BACT|nr:ABC transporter ATP-binding protein [Desulfosarcina alkanivorans]BBO71575.1 ABC transporter ATP-binding protein [Desulfosarcina alkanivorans]